MFANLQIYLTNCDAEPQNAARLATVAPHFAALNAVFNMLDGASRWGDKHMFLHPGSFAKRVNDLLKIREPVYPERSIERPP